jgi:hypothetical protein
MESKSGIINCDTLLDEWLTEPHKFGHLLGYTKLRPSHDEWIKIFLKAGNLEALQAHRGSYKTTCGIVAMTLLFLINPDIRLLIVRKNVTLASDVLKVLQKIMLTNNVVRLYLKERFKVNNASTNIWGSERTNFAFKKTNTPQPSITAAGIGAAITGAHYDYIWLDDIVTIDDRYSPAARKNTIQYFTETDNLVDPTGTRMLTSTPWHEEDLHSILPKELYINRKFPIGTVDMPEDELAALWERKNRLPYAEWMCNYELKHVADHDTLGAFLSVPVWDCQYSVAFIDPSFSDRQDTDSTAVAIAGVSKNLIIFTGRLWQKSIADIQTRKELLDFLDIYKPIQSVLESQLQPSSNVFSLDVLKADEIKYGYEIKNLFTIKHQTRNKHERISTIISANKERMRILEGTQQNFSIELSRYYRNVEHDDAPDSLAGAIEALGTSEIVAEYAKAIYMLNQRK